MTIEESVHVTFDETNHKLVELEVVDCTCILENITLEEKDQEVEQSQDQVPGQNPVQDLNKEFTINH